MIRLDTRVLIILDSLAREFPTLRRSEMYALANDLVTSHYRSDGIIRVLREICLFATERGLSFSEAIDIFGQIIAKRES